MMYYKWIKIYGPDGRYWFREPYSPGSYKEEGERYRRGAASWVVLKVIRIDTIIHMKIMSEGR